MHARLPSFCAGISATDSPAHVNLAAELIPIEYRWPTLLLAFCRRSAVSPCCNQTLDSGRWIVSGKSSSGCSTRTRCCEFSRRSTRRRRSLCFSPSWRRRTRPEVNWTRRTGEPNMNRSDWSKIRLGEKNWLVDLCSLFSSADWIVNAWLNCSSRWRTFRRLCKVSQPNLMMWVWRQLC